VFGEAHLRRILREYAAYYNGSRTHRVLNQDAPVRRPAQNDLFSVVFTINTFGFEFSAQTGI
jgi:hypothetical protein